MKSTTRAHIIQTASDLFYQKGYNLTGINEIIEKAGIAKATLYSHFRSKEDLCLAYLDARDSTLLQEIRTFCRNKSNGDKQLIAVLEFLEQFFEQAGFNGCWCIRTAAEIPRDNLRIKAKIKANKEQFLQFIQQLVKDNKPSLNTEKQLQLAKRIYLLYEGALTESHLQGENWPILENITVLQTILQRT